jgi:type IV pilus assembly protein PilA
MYRCRALAIQILNRDFQGEMQLMRNKQKGFSLIELLIVVAIILIIAAIAIPNLIRSKMAANEASAVATLRTLNTAEVVFSSTYNVANSFAPTLNALGDGGTAGTCTAGFVPTSTAACLIDAAVENASNSATPKSGYVLTYPAPTATGYTINNDPASPGSSGTRHFFTDQNLVIRQNSTGSAGATDTPI